MNPTHDKYVLAIDWLSIYCLNKDDLVVYDKCYEVKPLPYQTRHFKLIEEVYENDIRIATITRRPHSSVIDKNAVIIKFDNHVLYAPNLKKFVTEFLEKNNFIFKSISRLDIAKDFHTLNGYHVPEFIRQFLAGDILKMGKANFTVRGKHNASNEYQYIRFGSQTSETSYYLYNKSEEMREIKNKPYIKNHWKINSLNEQDSDVWRLEFTYKSMNRTLTDLSTGEITFINDLELLDIENINKLYNVSIKKYFQFVENNGLSRKDRMPLIELMPYHDEQMILQDYTKGIDTTRADKIFIKKLNDVYNELRNTNPLECKDLARVQHEYIGRKKLDDWARKKDYMIPYYDTKTFVSDRRFANIHKK